MDIYSSFLILISGIVSGLIVFQSIFVAPTVFKSLPEEVRPKFLREVFPKLFRSMALLGIIFLIICFVKPTSNILEYFVGCSTFLFGITCYALVPATNNAKDSGDSRKFSLLHSISVFLTMSALLVNLFWIFF